MARKKEKIDFKHNFKVYWSILKEEKVLFFLTLIGILLVEFSSVAGKFLFKIVIDKGTLYTEGTITQTIFISILLMVAAAYIGFSLLRASSNWLKLHFINKMETSMLISLKQRFFNHILHLSYSFHTNHKTGSLISRLGRGAHAIEGLTDTILFNFAPMIFQATIVLSSLIYFDLASGFVVLSVMFAFITFNIIFNKLQQSSHLQARNAEDLEKANVSDIFTNIDSVKCFGKESKVKRIFKKIVENTSESYRKNWNYWRWVVAGESIILGLGVFFIVYFSIKKFLIGEMTLGTLVFIYTAYGGLTGTLFGFVHGLRNFYRAMGDSQALFEYEKTSNEIKDEPNAKKLKIKEGTIEFKNVSFSYKKKKVFENFNLKIPANHKVALVGASGSGKTTLIRLLYRLYDVNKGAILIDGKNINTFNQETVRSEMSLVPQECILFDDTIYNNIAFSKTNAKKEDVFKAVRFAQLHNLIKNMPKQSKTIVGERGVKLSGGEKQRVSIARAILADKRVLVLDEATSALDSETEHDIQRDLHKLMQGRTSIVIAHRLSTIMSADTIIVLDQGRIVEQGTHNQLIRRNGVYRKLWKMQKGGYLK